MEFKESQEFSTGNFPELFLNSNDNMISTILFVFQFLDFSCFSLTPKFPKPLTSLTFQQNFQLDNFFYLIEAPGAEGAHLYCSVSESLLMFHPL